MNAVVTPADVAVGLPHGQPATRSDDGSGATSSTAVPAHETLSCVAPDEAAAKDPASPTTAIDPIEKHLVSIPDAAARERLSAFLDTWVPNPATRARLLELSQSATTIGDLVAPHTDVFAPSELPFGQRPFFFSFHRKGWSKGYFDSILMPYHGAIVSIEFSCVTAFTALNSQTSDGSSGGPITLVVVFMPIVYASTLVCFHLHEYASRVVLFHRLFEHKLVIRFKDRSFRERSTRKTLAVFTFWIVVACLFVFIRFGINYKLFLTATQSLGTMAWIFYSSLSVDRSLMPVTALLRHYETQADTEKGEHGGSLAATPGKRLADALAQVEMVDERCVKYDVFALNNLLAGQIARTKAEKNTAIACDVRVAELRTWRRMLWSWIGRLGHTKSSAKDTLPAKIRRLQTMKGYAALWGECTAALSHSHGSFGKLAHDQLNYFVGQTISSFLFLLVSLGTMVAMLREIVAF